MILVQMYNIFRLLIEVPDYGIVVSRMDEKKHGENDGHSDKLNKLVASRTTVKIRLIFYRCTVYLDYQ